jgi:PAS domain S-box-containing protein
MKLDELSKDELIALVRSQAVGSVVPGGSDSHDLQLQLADLDLRCRHLQEANRQLDAQRQRYSELYDFAPVAILTVDCDGRIQEVNLTAAAFFSTDRETLVGRPLSALVAPEDRPLLRSHLKRCMADRVRATSELRIELEGLGLVPHQLVSTALLEGGDVVGCKCALTDVSVVKRSEERLRVLARASAQFSSSLEVLRNLSLVVRMLVPEFADLAFADVLNDGGRVTRVEVACRDLAQREVVEALRRPVIPWVDPGEPLIVTASARAAFALAVAEGPERTAVVEACKPHAMMVVPVVAHERRLGLLNFVVSDPRRGYSSADLAFATDLAARVAMALDNSRLFTEAQAAIQARQDVLSIVSHDLKNPLAGIRLNADLMLKAAPPSERRKGRQQLERIKMATGQMSRLIDDLLDVGSIDSGRLSIDRRDQCLETLIHSAVELLGPLAQEQGMTLNVPAFSAPLWVACDRSRVLQVFSNLIGNALKFCARGATITVTAVEAQGKVRVTVCDDGPGIAPAVLRNLFQRFWQAPETAAKGHGLGLYISKGIIELLGGEIWVESKPGAGTTVQFTLPRVDPPQPHVVLVVEHDEGLREAMYDLLNRHGYGVALATGAPEALAYLSSATPRPQLILVDATGPDAREVVQAVKADQRLAATPLVVLCTECRAEDFGADVAIEMPIDFDALLAVVAGRAHAHA